MHDTGIPRPAHHITRRALMTATAGMVGVASAGLGPDVARADDPVRGGRHRLVKTPEELEQAIVAAGPGDLILMKNGTWTDVGIEFRAVGTEEAPITLRAQTPGKVVISGTSYLRIVGDHLVVDGLTFRDGAAPLDRSHLIQFSDWLDTDPSDGGNFANHCRLTNVVVDRFNKIGDGPDIWVGLWGHHNRVDHCAFLNKTSVSLLLIGWRPFGDPDHHWIDNNYFSDIPNDGVWDAAVAIRLGDGQQALEPAYSVIERNVFENMEGIGKIVHLKSSDSVIRDNTFWRASGAICTRAGDRNTIERNFIFPGLETNDGYYTGGILVIGDGHVIRGNYVQGCTSAGKAALQLYEGDPNNGPGVGTYYPTRNITVENNTFVDNAKNVIVGFAYDEDRGFVIPVENITYRENAVLGTDAPFPVLDEIDPPIGDVVYEDNQFFGGNLDGLEDMEGIEITDPGLVQEPDGTYRYRADSSLRDNLSTRPLTKDDVGPRWPWR